ncbi:MAG: phenazine biosynthesis protein [Candidatus Thorarchaeota archaeon]|nr:MAG: phenazine biosynthesis protein [Candidatus Thorarchaeota archaeon]
MRAIPFIQTSVFVDERYSFSGNQLATFWDHILNSRLTDEEMQGIALEMQHSETTFTLAPTLANCSSKVRIFTPGMEIPFAGHPTLGTAYVLRYKRLVSPTDSEVQLELGVGPIKVRYLSEDAIQMAQGRPKFMETWTQKGAVADAIGLRADEILDTSPMEFVSTGAPFLIVPVKSLIAIQRASPNAPTLLKVLSGQPSQDVVLFSTEHINADSNVHVRMFGPGVGVLEDPATGSAAGPLGAYLKMHDILPETGSKDKIVIEQGYEIRRPSRLEVTTSGGKSPREVYVSGKVRLVAEGRLYVRTEDKRS